MSMFRAAVLAPVTCGWIKKQLSPKVRSRDLSGSFHEGSMPSRHKGPRISFSEITSSTLALYTHALTASTPQARPGLTVRSGSPTNLQLRSSAQGRTLHLSRVEGSFRSSNLARQVPRDFAKSCDRRLHPERSSADRIGNPLGPTLRSH